MVTRILHISDLHFPSRDETVWQILTEAIVAKKPNVLVVTGDLANNPSYWWMFGKGHWIQVRDWLRKIQIQIEKDVQRDDAAQANTLQRYTRIIALSGNHDVLVSGLSGWCWPAENDFQRVFREFCQDEIYFDAKAKITFITLNTNPRSAICSAEGKALGGRLKHLKQAMDCHRDAAGIRASTKILLMHHHPLPVPFQGEDFLLHTRRVDRLLRFLAEQRIDLVLHGHKHRATWSHLRVGGATQIPFFVEVLGAGAAMKKNDYDPRGHNFNLIDVASGGIRQARQFFMERGSTRFLESRPSRAESEVGRLIQFNFQQPYRMKKLTWRVEADDDGDGKNLLTYRNLVFSRSMETYEVLLPQDQVVGGDVQGYELISATPSDFGASLFKREIDGSTGTYFGFIQQPTEQRSAVVEVQNYDFNTYAMDQREAAEKGLETDRDYIDLLLTDAVEELALEALFPASFRFEKPRLEVLEPLDKFDITHQGHTSQFTACLKQTGNRLDALLTSPPPNFRYRLSWDFPRFPQSKKQWDEGTARRAVFEQAYLDLLAIKSSRTDAKKELLWQAAIEGLLDLYSALEDRLGKKVGSTGGTLLNPETMDLSFMVCDRYSGRPQLRLILWNLRDEHPEVYRDFRLGIGEGNAGRAYKTKAIRLFDVEEAKRNIKLNTYRSFKNKPEHLVLVSIPLIDWRSKLPLGVLNAGVLTGPEADVFRGLGESDMVELSETVHNGPLKALLGAADLEV